MTPEHEIFDTIIRRRRSFYQKDYLPGRVDDAIIHRMLENADRAPTHKRTEPWRFMVFTGEGLGKLADFQAACYKEVTTADGTFREDRYQNLLTKPREMSHIISVGMKREPAKSLPEWEELGAVFCAVENMYLTATAYGVGCYLSTGGITNFTQAKPFFGLGEDDRLCGFLHVGLIPPHDGKVTARRPLEEKVKWIS